MITGRRELGGQHGGIGGVRPAAVLGRGPVRRASAGGGAVVSGAGGSVTRGMRRMLWVAAGLVLVQGSILLAARNDTSRYFSWTIAVPVTAAFLGAGYLSAAVLEAAAARQGSWQRARIAVPGVLAFTTLTLAVTPPVYREQRVAALLVGDQTVIPPRAITLPAIPRPVLEPPVLVASLDFSVPADLQPGVFLLRVQVDGAESKLVTDTDPASPTFNQYIRPKVTIT